MCKQVIPEGMDPDLLESLGDVHCALSNIFRTPVLPGPNGNILLPEDSFCGSVPGSREGLDNLLRRALQQAQGGHVCSR